MSRLDCPIARLVEPESAGTWNAGAFGYQEDATGPKLLGHRYYDSSLGRFITRDPIKDGRNWYAYCGNDPVNGVDPSGLDPDPLDDDQKKQVWDAIAKIKEEDEELGGILEDLMRDGKIKVDSSWTDIVGESLGYGGIVLNSNSSSENNAFLSKYMLLASLYHEALHMLKFLRRQSFLKYPEEVWASRRTYDYLRKLRDKGGLSMSEEEALQIAIMKQLKYLRFNEGMMTDPHQKGQLYNGWWCWLPLMLPGIR